VQLAAIPAASGLVAHARVAPDGAVALSTLRGAVAVLEPGAEVTTVLWPAVEDASTPVGLRGLAISGDGQTIYAGSPTERSVLVWSRHTHAADAPIPSSSAAQALAASPDGSMLAIGGRDGSVQLVTLGDRVASHSLAADDESISAMAFAPHGDRLAVADQSGRVRILDVHDAHVVLTAHPHRRYINGITWSGDGRWLVTAADDPSVVVLSATDLTAARIVRTATATISAALGMDGSHLVFHDGRSIIQLDLRMAMTETDPATLLSRAQDRAGVVLDGLMLAARE
jgi:WD40 repeat protein